MRSMCYEMCVKKGKEKEAFTPRRELEFCVSGGLGVPRLAVRAAGRPGLQFESFWHPLPFLLFDQDIKTTTALISHDCTRTSVA